MAVLYIVLSVLLSIHLLRGSDAPDVTSLQNHILHIEETVSNLQTQAQIQEQKQAAVLSSVLSELSSLRTDYNSLQTELNTVKDKLKANEIKLGEITSEVEYCTTNLTSLQIDVTSMKTDLNTSEESLNTLRYEVLDLHVIQRNQTSMESLRSMFESDLQAMTANLSNFQSEVDAVKNTSKTTKEGLETLESEVESVITKQGNVNIDATMNLTSELSTTLSQLSVNVSDVQMLCQATSESMKNMSDSLGRERSNIFFKATLTSSPSIQYTSGSRIIFQTSTGKGYNKDTGIYTVPISGTYLFWINAIIVGENHPVMVHIQGTNIPLGIGYGSTAKEEDRDVLTGFTVATFRQGEEVWFNSTYSSTFGILSSFGGALLHSHD